MAKISPDGRRKPLLDKDSAFLLGGVRVAALRFNLLVLKAGPTLAIYMGAITTVGYRISEGSN